jgi:hypothetical protein
MSFEKTGVVRTRTPQIQCYLKRKTRLNVHRAKLFERRLMPLTTGDIPVATDAFLHDLEPHTVEALRQAVERGLTPSGLDFTDDDSIVVLRLTRRRASDAHLMVSVEYSAEENEVVGKVYDAESRLKHATEPRDAHLAGSVRATVSRLLRELATKIAGDPSF